MDRPIIAITMGDPAGIGPEIVLKALQAPGLREHCRPVLLGEPEVFQRAAELLGLAPSLRAIAALEEAAYGEALDVLPASAPAVAGAPWGQISADTARAMLAPLDLACDLAQAGRVHAIASAPLNKEAFPLLGHPHGDELQYMAERTNRPGAFILGIMRGVWVTTVAEHVPFRAIADLITEENVLRYIRGLHAMMERAGLSRPHIAVAALNVHGGEGGALGTEEITAIGPAVQAARAEGIDAVGPFPGDTVYARALAGEFAGVVGMYHDQANIARKLQPMAERVTLYEGLPVPCSTTAHGVAYDIAGKGVANAGGMQAAIEHAIRLARG
jgi:4-phospho-D-threonate 3-dehydrogenase / 4-phospho-D-erythronate 3-dehydrogenase